jgi:imidazolonepropionase-like amidohydrolase
MSKLREKILIFLLFILWISGLAFAEITAIRAGNLIDPAIGTVAQDQIILAEDGKIVEVGPNIKIPVDAQTVDLSKA